MSNFSPNMLKTFQTCPKKYYYKYVENIPMPQKSSYFEKGKKIHALANYYLRGDNIEKFETVLTSDELAIWNNLKQNEFFQKKYIASEYNLSCKLDNYWIGGRLDALVKDENFYYILDYKTGQIPKNPEYDYQTMLYLLCVSKKYGNNIKFVYIDLKNNQNYIIDFTRKDEYEKTITQTLKNLKNILANNKIIEHSNICNSCEYKKICI